MTYDRCDEATRQRKSGNPQGAVLELIELFGGQDPFNTREEAWREHFGGRFADRVNEAPGRSGDRLAANVLWDACRQAATTEGCHNWFQNPRLDEAEEALTGFVGGGVALPLVKASVAVLRAACALASEDDKAYQQFPQQFATAARHYGEFWNTHPRDQMGIAHLPPAEIDLNPRNAELHSDHWAEWVRLSVSAIAEVVRQQWSTDVPGASVPIGLAMAEHGLLWVLGMDPGCERDSKTTIVFAGTGDEGDYGVFAHLHIQRHGDRPCVFYPDPVALGLMSLDPDWRTSFDNAARFIERHAKQPLGSCSWSVRFPWPEDVANSSATAKQRQQRVDLLEGGSASAAAACGLYATIENKPLDRGTCITGQITDDGRLDIVGGRVAKVLGLPGRDAKTAAGEAQPPQPRPGSDEFLNMIGTYVRRLLTVQPSDWLMQAGEARDIRVQHVDDVAGAIDRACRRADSVVGFLRSLAQRGLEKHVLYKPAGRGQALREFCIEPRVIRKADLDAWQQRERGRRDQPSGVSDEGSIDSLSERFVALLDAGGDTPRPIPLAHAMRSGLVEEGRQFLYGDGGSGKTTALWIAVADQCENTAEQVERGRMALDSVECRAPLVLPLGSVPPDGPFEIFGRARRTVLGITYDDNPVLAAGRSHVEDWLDAKLERNEVHLFLDALDEFTGETKELNSHLSSVACCPVFLTARHHAVPTGWSGYDEWLLGGFQQRDVRIFVKRYFAQAVTNGDDPAAQLLQRLQRSPGPRDLVRLPLLLAIACDLWQRERELPSTKTGLLALGLGKMLQRGDEKRGCTNVRHGRNIRKERLLRWIAWEFFSIGPERIEIGRLDNAIRKRLQEFRQEFAEDDLPGTIGELIEELKQDGILIPAGHGHFRFVLRTFHEYCVAGWIACESPPIAQGDHKQFKRMIRGRAGVWGRDDWQQIQIPESDACFKPLNQPGWKNVWPMVAGQLGSRADVLVQAVLAEDEDVALSRLQLAARMCGETNSSPSTRKAITQALASVLRDDRNTTTIRASCAVALGMLGGEVARDVLDAALNEDRIPLDVQMHTVVGLRMLGSEGAWEVLDAALNNERIDRSVRESCVIALAVLGDDSIWGDVAAALNDEQTPDWAQRNCTILLERLAELGDEQTDEQSRGALIAALNNDRIREMVRVSCAVVLGKLRGEQAREALDAALNNDRIPENVRAICAISLGEIGDTCARETLATTLNNDQIPDDVRERCVIALATLGDDRACESLALALNNDRMPEAVRTRCAIALGVLGDERGREMLAATLNDEQTPEWVREKCVDALGAVGDEWACELLAAAMNDEGMSPLVRGTCAGTLGALGDQRVWDGVLALNKEGSLLDILRHRRFQWMVAQGETDDEQAWESLADAIKNEQIPAWLREMRDWYDLSDEELDDLPLDEVSEKLVAVVNNEEIPGLLRGELSLFLCALGGEWTWQALAAALNNEQIPSSIRVECAYALGNSGSHQASDLLTAALNSDRLSLGLRGICADALMQIGDERARDGLITALTAETSLPVWGNRISGVVEGYREQTGWRLIKRSSNKFAWEST